MKPNKVSPSQLCLRPKVCRQCDMGSIIKDYIKPLIQLLTNDIISYGMENSATKCLNTAVMLMYFMMGEEEGIKIADSCDCTTYNNKSRTLLKESEQKKIPFDQNEKVVKKLSEEVLSHNNLEIGKRMLYYVLLTDASFESPEKPDAFFPGHVFIIEKFKKSMRSNAKLYYNLYQSYINEYDLEGYYHKNNQSFSISFETMKQYMENLQEVMTAKTWDSKIVNHWKALTKIDTTQDLLNTNCENKFFICYREVNANYCIENILHYAQKKLTDMTRHPENYPEHEINGNKNMYRYAGITNKEMKIQLEGLITKIKDNM